MINDPNDDDGDDAPYKPFKGGSLWQKSLCSRGGSHQHNNTGFAEEQTDSKFSKRKWKSESFDF